MKTTYLLRETMPDGTVQLVETTSANWHAIVKADAALPRQARRFFIYDIIPEENGLDCMVIETTWEVWREWDNSQRAIRRNQENKRKFSYLSLDRMIEGGDREQLHDRLLLDDSLEPKTLSGYVIMELREALAIWNDWGTVLLDFYLEGKKKSCTKDICQMYGVSEQTARKYKRQFEDFVKKYFA